MAGAAVQGRTTRQAPAKPAAAARLWASLLWGLRAAWDSDIACRLRGGVTAAFGTALIVSFATYDSMDPSGNVASAGPTRNILGGFGAGLADAGLQSFGLAAWIAALAMVVAGLHRAAARDPRGTRAPLRIKALAATVGVLLLAGALAGPQPPAAWPMARGLGGFWGDGALNVLAGLTQAVGLPAGRSLAAVVLGLGALGALVFAVGLSRRDFVLAGDWLAWSGRAMADLAAARFARLPAPEDDDEDKPAPKVRRRAAAPVEDAPVAADDDDDILPAKTEPKLAINTPKAAPKPSGREARESQAAFDFVHPGGFHLPELAMLSKPKPRASTIDEGALRQNARLLENVLAEFGVKGTIDQIRPGPVVTLYELAPAAGVKSSRVMSLSDDIARSMSARACRVSVVQGRNAIGIELPNARRETVYLRDLLSSAEYEKSGWGLPMALGETIQGEPYVADLAKMPHLLIAGTTGSGKSVGVNAMILSILYRLPPDQCRFIMIDPKMLELSVYDGIPHLLAPVVTDPKKAIVALKWTVREMENRYRLMSKIGVRNVSGYNEKAREAAAKGEHFERTVQTGFDDAGRPVYESEKLNPEPMPYLVVVIDEVADLMMVAGKDIEGAVQRLAQMARAAGIHLIMATQRPSVDVITGTIKANFPTRISFQVTSKIDARTILGEQGAEQLLGQGDMLYMAGGGRVTRLHGPFVSDGEVEAVAAFLRQQGEPQYLEEVTAAPDEDEEGGFGEGGEGGSGDDLYDQAVAVVTRDRKASTSYIQRRLQIGYNRAASLIEKMEKEGVVSAANHAGKRDILAGPPPPL
ncbi:MAG: cell division protein FtsK [Caulobacterales bacterium 32-69-10]|nr:MAG: cell division protein FtsK [Caulobacterales bacterium 32-69-10]